MDRNKVQEIAEMGLASWETIAKACLNFMSEDDVAKMAEWHGLALIYDDILGAECDQSR
jgi:hypothetical protein